MATKLVRDMFGIFECQARIDEGELPQHGPFTARLVGHYCKSATVIAALSMAIGLLMLILRVELWAFFAIAGGVLALILPTLWTWRCEVDRERMCESYYLLCFKRKKEVLWRDVKYKKVRAETEYSTKIRITLYNAQRKRLISFDELTVGTARVIKMASRYAIGTLPKK